MGLQRVRGTSDDLGKDGLPSLDDDHMAEMLGYDVDEMLGIERPARSD